MIETFVLFGAAGDLASRLVLPALRGLPVRVVGADARPGPAVNVVADVTSAADVGAVLSYAGAGPLAVYLALPSQLMLPAVQSLAACGLPPGSRVAIEKPFGHDGASATLLDEASAALPDVYRVDHFLAMSGVMALPAETAEWSSRSVAQLDLLFDETLALEGRASFYDRAGALRDVVQNHLFAVLGTLCADKAQDRTNVLRAVRPVDVLDTRRARYDGYLDEPGVDPANDTETFAELSLYVDLPRWTGVRFRLQAGKALASRRRGVTMQPLNESGLDPVWLDFDLPEPDGTGAEPRAYQRIVADLLSGGHDFSISSAEALESWRIVDPILAAWHADAVPMEGYSS